MALFGIISQNYYFAKLYTSIYKLRYNEHISLIIHLFNGSEYAYC